MSNSDYALLHEIRDIFRYAHRDDDMLVLEPDGVPIDLLPKDDDDELPSE